MLSTDIKSAILLHILIFKEWSLRECTVRVYVKMWSPCTVRCQERKIRHLRAFLPWTPAYFWENKVSQNLDFNYRSEPCAVPTPCWVVFTHFSLIIQIFKYSQLHAVTDLFFFLNFEANGILIKTHSDPFCSILITVSQERELFKPMNDVVIANTLYWLLKQTVRHLINYSCVA